MVQREIKIEENAPKEKNVVERRIRPTVIRRRKAKQPPKAEVVLEAQETATSEMVDAEPKVDATGDEEIVEVSEPESEEVAEVKKVVRRRPIEIVDEKKKSLRIIAQPEDVEEPGPAPNRGTSAVIAPPPPAKDLEALLRRPSKKRKSRAELQLEDIQKQGGLKQYARVVTGEQEQPTDPSRQRSRVFEPGVRHQRKRKAPKKGFKKTLITEPKAIKKVIKMNEGVSVSELSQSMGVKASDIIKKLMDLGTMATMNASIDFETASLVVSEYGFGIEHVGFKEEDMLKTPAKDGVTETEEPRWPVVTVMGHVDHGKTSILDIIRETDVASGEAGGITQHIGAYTVAHGDKQITFVDTPGHEAFTHMRARGAQVTDLVILVIAADDGVMPQTKEAIDHAKAAGVPIIVALNKIDKPNADQDKVKRGLAEAGLQPEDWGGDTICVPTSAKTKEGIDQLLEMVLLQAEILELKAVRTGCAQGIVIESRMDKRRGPIVTGIVKHGVLKRGDSVVSGAAWGRARVLNNSKGEAVEAVYPSDPVEILGLSEVPEAGERFTVVGDEKNAKLVSEKRSQRQREELLVRRSHVTLEDLKSQIEHGETKELNIIIKTDVKGVSDAVSDSLPGLSTKDVKIRVIHAGVGGITESDIMLATASNAVVMGFNVVADPASRELAEQEKIEIKRYSVIYEMLDDIKKAIVGMLKPKEIEKVLGRAEVRDTFKVPKIGVIAGCMVTSGKVTRTARVRLLRDNVIIHDGKIFSLKRFKDDAKEVNSGLECGIGVEKYGDLKVGDEIEAYIIEEVATTWEESKEASKILDALKKEEADKENSDKEEADKE